MQIPFVDLHRQHKQLEEELNAAIQEVIETSAFVRGPFVEKFEKQFPKISNARHCISCANGTDALYASMRALKIRSGDEVITTAHSWISTSETITQAGGRVVFCDTDSKTYTIDPLQIEQHITERTVGIIPVHLFGQAADMDAIARIAKKHKLWILEDCAQAHLADFNGQRVGTFGNAATYSFYPGKNLGAIGDAGCIVTDDDQLAEYSTLLCRHGGKNNHQIEGINSRMDGLQAAVLCVKMNYLAQWTELRRAAAAKYNQLLQCIEEVSLPIEAPGRKHVYHLYVIRCPRRDELQNFLKKSGIATVINYPRALPLYDAYAYLGHSPKDFPVASKNQDEILSIPIFPEISDEQIEYVAGKIRGFYSK